jgi:hypothetical protein
LIELRDKDNKDNFDSLNRKYIAPSIQNELLLIISDQILEKILPKDIFSIIVDETTDISKHEQVLICIR